MVRWSRLLRARAAKLWLVFGVIAAASALGAAEDSRRHRFVEVRAGDAVLADGALLLEHAGRGLLLRLSDLSARLPDALPRVRPVAFAGRLYLPLSEIEGYWSLDGERGVLTFLAPGDAGLVAPGAGPDPAPPEAPGAPALQAEVAAQAKGATELLWLEAGDPPVFRPPPGPGGRPLIQGDREVPGPVRRRDPLDVPLLPDDEWLEWLLRVVLNGQPVSEGALFLRGPEGRFAARVLDLRAWRVRLDEADIITLNGEPFYPLDALPGLEQRFDESTLTIELTLPSDQFEASAIARGRPSYLAPSAGTGAYFDYNVLYLTGEGLRERLDALLELGAFNEAGVLITNFRAGDVIDDEREFVRLDTTLIRDFPEERTSLRVGDSLTAGGALGQPVRFAGLQWASNFATDPTFIAFPLPSIGGLADQPSTAEVFLDNTRRVLEEIPPGPFEIDSLPVVTGAGELQLRVTDLLGREQLITQNYYVSPRLLREGLSEFSYEVGMEREDFGEESFAYANPLAVGSHRYGFTNAITGEGRIEAAKDSQTLGAGGSALLGTLGLISSGVIGSHGRDAGLGYAAYLDYEYRASMFDVGVRTAIAAADFRQLGSDDEPPDARTDQASFGLSLQPFGRIGALFINSEARGSSDRQAVSANYSVSIGPGTLLVNALQTLAPDEELAVAATYALPLGSSRSVSTTAAWREDGATGGVQYRQGRGSSDLGLSYDVSAEAGDDARLFDGSLRYDAEVASGQIDVARFRGDTSMRANVSGSLAYLDGKARVSRRLGRAFGLVALPGHPDVTVYLENREVGRTDEDGYLLLPRLNPYQENRIRIRPEDLPITAEIGEEELVAVPYERAGVAIGFDIRTQRTALATLLDGTGAPLPAGLTLTTEDGATLAQVADEGLAYVKGTGAGPEVLASTGPAFSCPLPALSDQPMQQLGTIRCTGARQ
jgi:outer membrane usher protein